MKKKTKLVLLACLAVGLATASVHAKVAVTGIR
jgi:hypothetical protein